MIAMSSKEKQSSPDVILHPLLQFTQSREEHDNFCQIVWDVRDPISTARLAASPDQPFDVIIARDLLLEATTPPLQCLPLHLEILPEPWPLRVQNPNGVRVCDILMCIYNCLHARISHAEWGRISPKQRTRINEVFQARCQAAPNPHNATHDGILRVDCLLRFTVFSGLTLDVRKRFDQDKEEVYAILMLRRYA